MNKKNFIDKLSELSGYKKEDCAVVNDSLESHLIVGKKGQERIINDIEIKLGIDREEANKLYGLSISILNEAVKSKIRNTFKKKKSE